MYRTFAVTGVSKSVITKTQTEAAPHLSYIAETDCALIIVPHIVTKGSMAGCYEEHSGRVEDDDGVMYTYFVIHFTSEDGQAVLKSISGYQSYTFTWKDGYRAPV